jgi:hypothetical protein
VIAPTLAQIYGGGHKHGETAVKEIVEIKTTQPSEAVVPVETTFLEALVKDQVIDKENFSLELKENVLTINGVVQPKEVLEKYSPLLKGVTSFKAEVKAEN